MPATRSLSEDEHRLAWRIVQTHRRTYDEDVILHALQARCPHAMLTYHNRCVDCAALIEKGKVVNEQ